MTRLVSMKLSDLVKRVPTAFDLPMWRGMTSPVEPEEIRLAIEENRLNDPVNGESDASVKSRDWHVERIAWFVVHDSENPISICWGKFLPVQDGNHRVAAAIYAGRAEIDVQLEE